jgi:uncharacterized protein
MGLIYLDSCLLIYAYENNPLYGESVRTALSKQPPEKIAISPLTKMECLVKPIKTGNLVVQRYYEESFESFSWLPMSDAVYELATLIRARFNLKTPDALHLACAQHHGCEALWTNDERLTQAGHGLARNIFK